MPTVTRRARSRKPIWMKTVSAQVVSCCVYDKSGKNYTGIIRYIFDYWAGPGIYLLLLKSSMPRALPMHQHVAVIPRANSQTNWSATKKHSTFVDYLNYDEDFMMHCNLVTQKGQHLSLLHMQFLRR